MNWDFKSIEEIAEIIKGKKPNSLLNYHSKEYCIPYITIEAFENQRAFQYTNSISSIITSEKDDIVIVWDGARFGLIGKSFGGALGSTLAKIIPKKFMQRDFLHYFLKNNFNLIRSNQRGAGIPHIDGQFLRSLPVPIPSLSEQKKIVEILEQADELRRKKKEAIEKSEKIITSLFYKMFGDPIESKEFIKLESLVEQIERRNPSARPEEEFKYVDIAGVDGIKGEIVSVKNLLGNDAPVRARQVIKAKDVIVSTVRPYLRATALVPDSLDNQICSTGFCVLRSKSKTGYGFICAMSRLEWFTQRLNDLAKGAAYPAVSDQDILTLEIPKPKKELLDKFDKLIDNIIIVSHSYQESYKKLVLMYESIQHRAFTGELTSIWREKNKEQLKAEIADRKLTYGF